MYSPRYEAAFFRQKSWRSFRQVLFSASTCESRRILRKILVGPEGWSAVCSLRLRMVCCTSQRQPPKSRAANCSRSRLRSNPWAHRPRKRPLGLIRSRCLVQSLPAMKLSSSLNPKANPASILLLPRSRNQRKQAAQMVINRRFTLRRRFLFTRRTNVVSHQFRTSGAHVCPLVSCRQI